MSGDTASVYNVLYAVFRLTSDALTILLICMFMLVTEWQFSVLMMIMAAVCVLFIYVACRKGMQKTGMRYREYLGRASQAVYEAFGGIKDVLVLRRQRYFVDSYERNQVQVQIAQSKQVVGMESPAYMCPG